MFGELAVVENRWMTTPRLAGRVWQGAQPMMICQVLVTDLEADR